MSEPAKRDYGGDPAKKWKDLWAAGQGIGAVKSVEPIAAIVDRIVAQYDAAKDRLK